MNVTVRLFAGLRERAGKGQLELELERGSCVSDVWPALELGELPNGLLFAINRQYAPPTAKLEDGDEVALIPPVSGGAFRLTEKPIDPSAVIAEVASDHAGGIASFIGTVRIESRGRTVRHLEYEAYSGMAENVMSEIAERIKRTYDLSEVAISHRTGRVEIGELSVVIAVSAPHRADALAACKEAIDRLKETVPL